MPSIGISTPINNATVAGNFRAAGTVSSGIATVTVTLTSSKAGVAAVNQVVDSSTGTWTCNFNVDPNDFPGNSTLTATITGTSTSTTITVKVGPATGGGGG